jgi:hypothetical protein
VKINQKKKQQLLRLLRRSALVCCNVLIGILLCVHHAAQSP